MTSALENRQAEKESGIYAIGIVPSPYPPTVSFNDTFANILALAAQLLDTFANIESKSRSLAWYQIWIRVYTRTCIHNLFTIL